VGDVAADRSSRANGGPRLLAAIVADDDATWAAAGFRVEAGVARVDATDLVLAGPDPGGSRGLTGWTLAGVDPGGLVDGALDGLPTTVTEPGDADDPDVALPHPNGVVGLDHVVVATPNLERTIEACAAIGLDLRRIRDVDETGTGLRQAFFRLGPTLLEVVSGPTGSGRPASEEPATFFGLALDVDDLDATALRLGDGLGPIKPAVQPGRRIATLRHRTFAMTTSIALMDRHGERAPGTDR